MAKISATIYRKGIQRCVDVPKTALSRARRRVVRPAVVVSVAGRMFESTLLPLDLDHFQLVMPMAILRALGRDHGDRIEIQVKPDPARTAPPLPEELDAVLRSSPPARRAFQRLTIARQREIVRFIDSARSESARRARAERIPALLPAQSSGRTGGD